MRTFCVNICRPNGQSGGIASPVLKNIHAWEEKTDNVSDGSQGSSSSNSESVFVNPHTEEKAPKAPTQR